MLTTARNVIVAADSSKFGKGALAAVAPLSGVNGVVTDTLLDSAVRSHLEDSGLKVLLA